MSDHAHCLNNLPTDQPKTFFPGSDLANELDSAITEGVLRLFQAMDEGRDEEVGPGPVDELIVRIMTQATPADRYEAIAATLTFLLQRTCEVLAVSDQFVAAAGRRAAAAAGSN